MDIILALSLKTHVSLLISVYFTICHFFDSQLVNEPPHGKTNNVVSEQV